MLFSMVADSIKSGAGKVLTNGQNLQILKSLQECQKMDNLSTVAQKLEGMY